MNYPEFPWKDEAEFNAYLIMGNPKADALKWIRSYAESLGGEYDDEWCGVTEYELISTALTHISDDPNNWGDFLVKGGLLEDTSVDPTFWDKLSVLLDYEIPSDNRNSFFSCSC